MEKKNDCITVGEMIEYLQKFPEDSDINIVVLDTHQDQKVGFCDKEVLIIIDGDNPTIILNVDRNNVEDITLGEVESW